MKKIGIDGGHTVYKLGLVSDVVLFFECINRFVIDLDKENDWSLVSDRLYKRYLRKNELDKAIVLMDLAKSKFFTLPAPVVLCENKFHVNLDKTSLNFNQDTLGDIFFVFSIYFQRRYILLFLFLVNLEYTSQLGLFYQMYHILYWIKEEVYMSMTRLVRLIFRSGFDKINRY